MRTFESIEDLTQAAGAHLGYSQWHTVTQAQIDLFARATGDQQWIHVDPEKAPEGPFGTTIAHGYLTLSLVPKFVWEIYDVKGIQIGVNYGSDNLRFPAPLPVGSTIRGGAEILSVSATDQGHRVTTRIVVERDVGGRPVCIVDTLSLFVT
ncbi:MaoC family dehydratase [Aeromicrobium sp. CF3.5]|uniref:MaoC family dehydratase n=1 Tax=Aeromicrobium sp. CF3.5 TaxID=3373078 RepID=UPI003EE75AFB